MGEKLGTTSTAHKVVLASAITVVASLSVSMVPSPVSAGSVSHPSVVSEDPADFTPNVVPDAGVSHPVVLALGQRKNTMYAGGRFGTVENSSGTQSYNRHNIVAFDATTGAVKDFAPNLNGSVWAVERYKKAMFVGGDFTTVDGVSRPAVVKLRAGSGAVLKTFNPSFTSGTVTQLRMARGKLIVGGSIPGKLRALDPRTGQDTGYISLPVAGKVADNAGPVNVYRFAVSPNHRRLVAVGNFTSVDGQSRWRAFMLDLRKDKATLNPWSYAPLQRECAASSIPAYLKDVDFSPDGTYFVLVASGFVPQSGGLFTDVCDAAARFETDVPSPPAPTWINYTGGDTLHSVEVTGAAVYVQGHQRWMDNPFGVDDAGPGAVSRMGIAALDPGSGEALAWNPGKTRGVGGKDMLATASGLWVASDGRRFAGELRQRLAFCPL
ncbi:MAG TPA: hypothetical protein VFX15_00350 [Actinomycetes bacterium]|nr:hypothetical protein [Actinomycetes bacterium]